MNGSEVSLSLGRESETSRPPREKGQIQGFFEHPHLLRDGALGDAEFFGREAEIEVPGGGVERAERIQRRQVTWFQ